MFSYKVEVSWRCNGRTVAVYSLPAGMSIGELLDSLFRTIEMEHFRFTCPNLASVQVLTTEADGQVLQRTGPVPADVWAMIYLEIPNSDRSIYVGSFSLALMPASVLSTLEPGVRKSDV